MRSRSPNSKHQGGGVPVGLQTRLRAPAAEALRTLARDERRSLANMAEVLIEEAIGVRQATAKVMQKDLAETNRE